jgi:hypothetical protein
MTKGLVGPSQGLNGGGLDLKTPSYCNVVNILTEQYRRFEEIKFESPSCPGQSDHPNMNNEKNILSCFCNIYCTFVFIIVQAKKLIFKANYEEL